MPDMWLIDGHEDLAYNAVEVGRDLAAPLERIRRAEGPSPAHGDGVATVCLPSLRAADIRIVVATIFVEPAREGRPTGYHTPNEAFARADAQLACYHHLQARGEATVLRRGDELEATVAGRLPRPGLVLAMEGADPIRTPDALAYFVDRGVRVVGLAWKATRYAGGTGEPGPLTADGAMLLREMARLGVALDISHLAEEACFQALHLFPGQVVATHANCRALVPGDRQLSDDLIRAVAERDGVIGLVCYNRFITPGWSPREGKAAVSLADLRAHLDYLVNLVGIRHVALGSDLDGGIGRDEAPREIDSVADLPRLAGVLAAAGYGPDEIEAVMHDNWLRVLRTLLGNGTGGGHGVS